MDILIYTEYFQNEFISLTDLENTNAIGIVSKSGRYGGTFAHSGWNLNREISKLNYRIHTEAIRENLLPPELKSFQISITNASEAMN